MSIQNIISTNGSLKLIMRECLTHSNCLAILAATCFIFVIDLQLPLGVAAGTPYVLTVFASLWVSGLRVSYVVAALAIVFTIMGFFLSPGIALPMHLVLINRTMTLLLIVCAAIMVIRIKKANIDIAALMDQTIVDPVSGFKNQLGFDGDLNSEIERFKRYGHPLSLALIDVQCDPNNLKTKDILQEIKIGIRKTDLPYLINDNQLAIIFTDTDLVASKSVCEAIHKQICLKSENCIALQSILRIGITAMEKSDNPDTLLVRAKRALTVAQSNVENLVVAIPQIINKDKATVAAILLRSRSS